ncbi:MAG: LPS assembly lipoprotein LptE [Acidovorax sp.]
MQRRTLLTALAAAPLAACGFRLRGVPEFSFHSLYINAPAGSGLARELVRVLDGSGSKLQVLREPSQMTKADVIMDLLSEQRERIVIAYNSNGQVRQLTLRLRVHFKLRAQDGDDIVPDTEILQMRDQSYDETYALAKEVEANMLYRDMQSDIVQQLLRRLSSAKLD